MTDFIPPKRQPWVDTGKTHDYEGVTYKQQSSDYDSYYCGVISVRTSFRWIRV